MSKEDAVIILQLLAMSVSTCRTEREALEIAIEVLEEEENGDTGDKG